MRSLSLLMLSILYDLSRDCVDPWTLDSLFIPIGYLVVYVDGTASNLVGDSLNVPPGLFLITSVFVSTFPFRPKEARFFLFKLHWLFDCWRSVHFNVHLKFDFTLLLGLELIFDLFHFPLILKLIFVYFLWSVINFFVVCVVSFSIRSSLVFFYKVSIRVLWCLFWCECLFHQNFLLLFQQDLCPLGWILWIMGFSRPREYAGCSSVYFMQLKGFWHFSSV